MTNAIVAVLRRNLTNALKKGDLSQAALLLERLQEEDALSVETRGMELEYLSRSRRLPEARALADQLLQLFPNSPRIQYLAGQAAYQSRDYRTAAERYRESYRISAHWRSWQALAKALTQLGEFDEATRILESLVPEHAECHLELAWLLERKQDFPRALAAVEAYLSKRPDHSGANAQRVRLRARVMSPERLVSEALELREYGEQLADPVVPEYLAALFQTGQVAEARQFVFERRTNLSPELAAGAGWTCYRYQAYDLAWELFTMSFERNLGNAKFLSALEFAAVRCGRVADLISLYESHAPRDRRLFGRVHSLRRRSASSLGSSPS